LTAGNRNVTLDRVAGDVTVTNRNGSVDLTSAPPLGNVTVENRNGSVNLSLPEQASFAYQLDATNGDIESDFSEIKIPEDGEKKTISGVAGKGGPVLHISTSQGDISIKKASIMPLPPMPPMPKITPLPPMPKITAMPQDARQAMEEAKREARDAAREGKEAAAEGQREAKQATDEARREAKQAADEARREAKEAADEAKDAKQQKDPNE
jgi:Putative adhesin